MKNIKLPNANLTLGALFGFMVAVVLCALTVVLLSEVHLLKGIQAIGSPAIAAIAVFIAFMAFRHSVIRHDAVTQMTASQDYLEEAKALLERSYGVFMPAGARMPPNDRVSWLTAARLIVSYQKTRCYITEAAHLEIMDGYEEHFRHLYYRALHDYRDRMDLRYFSPEDDRYSIRNLQIASIAVVFEFIRWKDGKTDPLDDIDEVALLALNDSASVRFRGIKEYLAKHYENIWAQVLDRRKQDTAENR